MQLLITATVTVLSLLFAVVLGGKTLADYNGERMAVTGVLSAIFFIIALIAGGQL